jgi:hypothetical protein
VRGPRVQSPTQTSAFEPDATRRRRPTGCVEVAVDLLIEAKSVEESSARKLLLEAAQRAGVELDQLAETLLEVYRSRHDP